MSVKSDDIFAGLKGAQDGVAPKATVISPHEINRDCSSPEKRTDIPVAPIVAPVDAISEKSDSVLQQSSERSMAEETTYTQEQVNNIRQSFQQERESYLNRIAELECDRDSLAREFEQYKDDEAKRGEATKKWYSNIEDKSYWHIYELIQAAADYSCLTRKHGNLEKEYDELKQSYDEAAKSRDIYSQQCSDWRNSYAKLSSDLTKKSQELDAALSANNEFSELYEKIKRYAQPASIAAMEGFDDFFKQLETELRDDSTCSEALRFLSVLASFSIMERTSGTDYSSCKKQLVDLGGEVSHYLHSKMYDEMEVVQTMRNFAQAACGKETIAGKLGFSIKLPQPGATFQVNEVKHVKNGTTVTRILNWCVCDNNGPAVKALVE